MKFSVLTLFPALIDPYVSTSVLGRAKAAGLFQLQTIDIRDFAVNNYGQVDDQTYGGRSGMLLMAEPLMRAVEKAKESVEGGADVIYLSPRGELLTDGIVTELVQSPHLILVAGHYEGVDERFLEETGAREISIGDYVLTGGELPALVLIDAVVRRLPGVLPREDAFEDESHRDGLLEYPQYTRPSVWRGRAVPDVLRSGHAANIKRWKTLKKLETTLIRRPDLLKGRDISQDDLEDLLQLRREEEESRNL
jgi:tRNA (guanine37-N1)-methyltransferase